MEFNKHVGISELLNNKSLFNKNIEFVSLLFSSWHLDVFYSIILKKKLQNGLIIILPQSDVNNNTKYRLTQDNFTIDLGESVSVYFIDNTKLKFNLVNLLKLILERKRTNKLFLFNPEVQITSFFQICSLQEKKNHLLQN